MAYPTAVNSQITDSLVNGSEDTPSLPRQVVKMSQAFVQTLEMENTVFQQQVNGIVNMVLDAVQKLNTIKGDATTRVTAATEGLQNMANGLKAQVTDGVSQAAKAATGLPATNTNEQTLESILVQTVGESYKNAIAAQQHMYITIQAAATMTISTILSNGTANDALTTE